MIHLLAFPFSILILWLLAWHVLAIHYCLVRTLYPGDTPRHPIEDFEEQTGKLIEKGFELALRLVHANFLRKEPF